MAVSDSIRTCAHCASTFRRTAKGQSTKYCTSGCQAQATWQSSGAKERTKELLAIRVALRNPCIIDGCNKVALAKGWCAMHYMRWRAHGDPTATLKYRLATKPCAWCAKPMTDKPSICAKRVCCSRACAQKESKRKQGFCSDTVREFYCAGCGDWTRRKVREIKDDGKYCGRGCFTQTIKRVSVERIALRRIGDRRRAIEQRQYDLVVRPEVEALRRIARYVERPKTFQAPCADCGSQFLARRPWPAKVCDSCRTARATAARKAHKASDVARANRRIHKSRRRALERHAQADSIDPFKVFDRDKWTCQLCGIKTPKRLRGMYEHNAPELDHVLPLALGGLHVWGNVQCACRRCNGKKGASARGQFGLPIAA